MTNNNLLTVAELAKALTSSLRDIRKVKIKTTPKRTAADPVKFLISRINYDIMRGRLPTQKKTITKEITVVDLETAKKFYNITD